MAFYERFIPVQSSGVSVQLDCRFEDGLAASLIELGVLSQKLVQTQTSPFKVRGFGNDASFVATQLGLRLLRLLPMSASMARSPTLYCLHNPYVELLMSVVRWRHIPFHDQVPIMQMAQAAPLLWGDILNGLVDELRQRAHTRQFLTDLSRASAAVGTRYKQVRDYFRRLDAAHPCSSVISLELGYFEQFQDVPGGMEVQYRRLWQDTHEWLHAVSQCYGSALVGYVWKLDFSTVGFYKVHVVLMLTGPSPDEIRMTPFNMGLHWVRVAGRNAYSVDCNSYQELSVRYRGVGENQLYCNSNRDILDALAIYLARSDELLRLDPKGNSPAFGVMKESTIKKNLRR